MTANECRKFLFDVGSVGLSEHSHERHRGVKIRKTRENSILTFI